MSVFKPFKGFRPKAELAEKIACRPYDVLNSDEAREEVKVNAQSFLHVTKSEVDLPLDVDIHADIVYNKAKETLESWISQNILIQDSTPCYYIYAQTMWGRTQYGLVGGASFQDYLNNVIKKHELTRPDKEEDRKNHIRVTNFNAEPVFFAIQDNAEIDSIIKKTIQNKPIYDFTLADGVGHHFWVISEAQTVARIEEIFEKEVPCIYIADGHHRTAAAAHVGQERMEKNQKHSGKEEYNYFLAVIFQAGELNIIDYNRVVKDLNDLTSAELISRLKEKFEIEEKGTEIYKPAKLHNFSMYLDGKWFSLTAKNGTYNDSDPIGVLDVTILSNSVLTPILNIKDLRTSTRIDFVGGIRGLGELKKRVDSGEMRVAFALYPVSMKQLMDISDNDKIMPPKTTWFEPKLRSGLVIHCLE